MERRAPHILSSFSHRRRRDSGATLHGRILPFTAAVLRSCCYHLGGEKVIDRKRPSKEDRMLHVLCVRCTLKDHSQTKVLASAQKSDSHCPDSEGRLRARKRIVFIYYVSTHTIHIQRSLRDKSSCKKSASHVLYVTFHGAFDTDATSHKLIHSLGISDSRKSGRVLFEKSSQSDKKAGGQSVRMVHGI